MLALGVDVSSRKIAFGILDEDGTVDVATGSVSTRLRGARRLVEVRQTTRLMALGLPDGCCVCVVEVPWGSFLLLSVCAVVLEAIQDTLPNCVVLERQTTTWKLNSVGHGNATKGEVLDHAHGLGYSGGDQDVADALCCAQAAWGEWWAMERRTGA